MSGVTDTSGNIAQTLSRSLTPGVTTVELTIDASDDVNLFTPKIRGLTMQTTSWIWADIVDPGSSKRAALLEACIAHKTGSNPVRRGAVDQLYRVGPR